MDSRQKVLSALIEAQGSALSGQALGEALGISRAAVHRHIVELRALGYTIGSAPNRGYALMEQPDRLDLPRVLARLTTRWLGRSLRVLHSVDSTNAEIKRWAEEGAPHGAVVAAEEQTAGKGRHGRSWLSAPGDGLTMSLLLRPAMQPAEVQRVTLAAAAAVTEALEGLFPDTQFKIKWPNDILIGDRKVCGILTELSAAAEVTYWIVIGIGINVRGTPGSMPEAIRDTAGTLQQTGQTADRAALAAAVLGAFESLWDEWMESGSFDGVLRRYRAHMAYEGRPVRVALNSQSLEGVLSGVDDEGRLLIDTGSALIPLRSGEFSVRRMGP
ncbi:MAG: biotin--[acetyl-CoA-carboxylase] ligase [Clostridiales bacterium]|nr:biotin--[acetyl-CoA-carboxylase] ligase [Clostridiales bacterium]